MNYTGKYENGEIFDTFDEQKAKEVGSHVSAREYAPLELKVGDAQVIKGFDNA